MEVTLHVNVAADIRNLRRIDRAAQVGRFPREVGRSQLQGIDPMGAASLEPIDSIREAHSREETEERVDVVLGGVDGLEMEFEVARRGAELIEEGWLDDGSEHALFLARGPEDMDPELGLGAGHGVVVTEIANLAGNCAGLKGCTRAPNIVALLPRCRTISNIHLFFT